MELLTPPLGVKVPTMAERFALLDYLTANALRVSGASLPPICCSTCTPWRRGNERASQP